MKLGKKILHLLSALIIIITTDVCVVKSETGYIDNSTSQAYFSLLDYEEVLVFENGEWWVYVYDSNIIVDKFQVLD